MKKKQLSIVIGTRFHHIDCGYNMEVVGIKKNKGAADTVEVKYIDRDRPNFTAPINYIISMFNFERFIMNAA